MIIEAYPSYGAGGSNGLTARYAIAFGNDAIHVIPLSASYQGDPVLAKSLYVNNYSSQYAITVNYANYSIIIPAFSSGYVDIRGISSVQLTSESTAAGTINVEVSNFVTPYGVQTRTFQAASLTNDPFWNKVNFASHCQGVAGGTSIFNEKTITTTLIQQIGSITNSVFVFGNASLAYTVLGATGIVINLANAPTPPFSYGLFFYPLAVPNGDYGIIGHLNAAATFSIGYRVTGGNITNILTAENSTLALTVTPYQLSYGAWHYIGINVDGASNLTLWIDNNLVRNASWSSSGTNNLAALIIGCGSGISDNGLMVGKTPLGYASEIQFTSYPRFISSCPIPTAPFFNQ